MKRLCTISLVVLTLVSLAWVITPMVLIYPFRAQTPLSLAVGYALLSHVATLTLAFLAVGVVAASLAWRRLASWKGRLLACLAVAVLGGCAFLGRTNTFEAMFHPVPHPEFVVVTGVTGATGATDVAEEDLVLGVQIGDQAKAYPVRAMAYHHLVNDLIADEPIVATY
jgi:hypothetical protein